ncbi:MAG: hypothetical protein IT287_02345 [Bdellovibrionaceae bacterium]|nr:hypothetical protein [Pseudobdellovibrionaceae bacterium]
MSKFGFYFLFVFFSVVEVRAQVDAVEAVVIEVRKNTSLSKKEKVFKNFFINGGQNLGLQAGMHVDVSRRLPVHDPLKNASIGDLRVKVGTLEIIHSEGKISVARLVSYDSMEKRPLLDYEAVMVGDRLDLASLRAAPVVKEHVVPANSLQGEKVALLKPQSKAEKLIQEGERHLANLEMKTKAQAAANKRLARAPASVGGAKSKPKNFAKPTARATQSAGKTTLKKK